MEANEYLPSALKIREKYRDNFEIAGDNISESEHNGEQRDSDRDLRTPCVSNPLPLVYVEVITKATVESRSSFFDWCSESLTTRETILMTMPIRKKLRISLVALIQLLSSMLASLRVVVYQYHAEGPEERLTPTRPAMKGKDGEDPGLLKQEAILEKRKNCAIRDDESCDPSAVTAANTERLFETVEKEERVTFTTGDRQDDLAGTMMGTQQEKSGKETLDRYKLMKENLEKKRQGLNGDYGIKISDCEYPNTKVTKEMLRRLFLNHVKELGPATSSHSKFEKEEKQKKGVFIADFFFGHVQPAKVSALLYPVSGRRQAPRGSEDRPQLTPVGLTSADRQWPPVTMHGTPWVTFRQELYRMGTFLGLPQDFPVSPLRLAQAGFLRLADDSIVCYFCGLVRSQWSRHESPMEVHRQLGPDCPMVTGVLSDNVAVADIQPQAEDGLAEVMQRWSLSGRGGGAEGGGVAQRGLPSPPRSGIDTGSSLQPGSGGGSGSDMSEDGAVGGGEQGGGGEGGGEDSGFSSGNAAGGGGMATATASAAATVDNPGQQTPQQQVERRNPPARLGLMGGASSSSSPQPRQQQAQPLPRQQQQAQPPQRQPPIRLGLMGGASSSSPPQPSQPGQQPPQPPQPRQQQAQPPQRQPPIRLGLMGGASSNPNFFNSTTPNNNNNNNPHRIQSLGSGAGEGQTVTYQQLGIITGQAKRPDMATIESRLDTYRGAWVQDHVPTVRELAEAGFYYAGYADCSRCFTCGGGLRNWDPTDDPWVVHARWFPTCALVKQSQGQEFIDVIKDLNAVSNNRPISMASVKQEMFRRMDFGEGEEEMFSDPAVGSAVIAGFSRQAAETTATKMLQEGQTLSVVSLMERLEEDGARPSPTADDVSEVGLPGDNSWALQEFQMEFDRLKEENSELRQQGRCKICLDREASVIFLACGHLVTCPSCSPALRACPVCRLHIKGRVRIFRP